MSTLSVVVNEFAGLSADRIAKVLQRRGIKGRMGTTYGCPMALLLDTASTGKYVIGRRYIVRVVGRGKFERIQTPRNITEFMRKFDRGGYPNLIAPPPRCLAPKGPKRSKQAADGRTGDRHKRGAIKHHLAKLVGRFAEIA